MMLWNVSNFTSNNTRTEMTSQIDLSKYVGKKVRVTFRNTVYMDEGIVELDKGIVELTEWDTYPYRIHGNAYSKDGKWKNSDTRKHDILTIEEIQMNNYQELENKVKELQAEIDRLKAQELKSKSLYNILLDDFDVDDCEIICHNVENWLPPDDPHDGEEFQLGWNACLGYLRDKIK